MSKRNARNLGVLLLVISLMIGLYLFTRKRLVPQARHRQVA